MTYDQAFVLLAAAELHRYDGAGAWDAKASVLLGRIQALRRDAAGGFSEEDGRFLSNPHMHLFEACLGWMEADGGGLWSGLADEIAGLPLDQFFDAGKGVLREVFDARWSPVAGEAGDSVEPGHQFEWAWLLERWSRLAGDLRGP